PRGVVAVTAPANFGRMHVRPVLDAFLDAQPLMSLRLLLLDRIINLVEEGFDAAIRIGHLPDSSLAAVKLGQLHRLTCASPDYLAHHPAPRHPADLARHRCIVVSQSAAADHAWRFPDPAGRGQKLVRSQARLCLNDALAAAASAA